MASSRKYSPGVLTGLISLAQGTCYYPDCDEYLVRFVDGQPVNNYEIAHIRARNDHGPRADPSMSDQQRNEFANLVLLCLVHHKTVDKLRPQDFTTEMLQGWKAAREGTGLAALQGIRGLTEDRLQELVSESFESFKSDLENALTRLEATDAETARLLRTFVDSTTEGYFHARFPSADTAEMLSRAATNLFHLQDTAPFLMQAASDLGHLKDTAVILQSAARQLNQARDYM